ncbi:MAG: hypothetical protein N2578_07535 [Bdellovibrionaceae bacterium]|nr:hypothetical protein [Pseudobdellovibrionaceae bacterium]
MGSRFIGFCLLLLGASHLHGAPNCPQQRLMHRNIQAYYTTLGGGEVCAVSVHPVKVTNMVYRDYLFTSEGLLMVFNSFGWGPPSSDTGAREFFFFPRGTEAVRFESDLEKDLFRVRMVNGKWVQFEGDFAQISAIESGTVKVSADVNRNNNGGIEFPSFDGLILDGGWLLGSSPFSHPSRSSTFRDGKGKTCQVKNSEIFTYSADGDYFHRFNDRDLKLFLARRCPGLDPGY